MALQCKTFISTTSIADMESKISAWLSGQDTTSQALVIRSMAAAEGSLGGQSIKCIVIYEILNTPYCERI